MSKPTPGEWRVEDRRGAPLKNIRVVAGQHEVCQVHDVHQRDYLGGFDGDHKAADAVDAVGLANAHLLSAAPDLLAACERFVKNGVCSCAEGGSGFICDICDARAAIRKATGQRGPT